MQSFVSDRAEQLLELLSNIDIRVPARGLERLKEHTQRWAIARFLATFASSEILKFPLEVTSGERPDFVLIRAGSHTGVEATEAIHEDHARIDALSNLRGYTEPRLYYRIRAGEPRKSRAEIEAIASGHADSGGWAGESVEQDWAEAMLYVIRKKRDRFAQPGFRKFPENWLLIYDNWELPFIDRDRAAQKLSAELRLHQEATPFDRIFIETGNLMFEYQGPAYTRSPLNDLWMITTLEQ
jgi:hypothetical protein